MLPMNTSIKILIGYIIKNIRKFYKNIKFKLMFNSKDQLKYLANPKYSSKYQAKSISPKTLKDLYYEMLKIRKVELKIADLVHRKKVNTPVHLSWSRGNSSEFQKFKFK